MFILKNFTKSECVKHFESCKLSHATWTLDASTINHGHRFRLAVGAWLIRFSRSLGVGLSGHWGTLSVTGTFARGEFTAQ